MEQLTADHWGIYLVVSTVLLVAERLVVHLVCKKVELMDDWKVDWKENVRAVKSVEQVEPMLVSCLDDSTVAH